MNTAVDSATGKSAEDLVGEWLSLSEAAVALGLNQNKAKQLIRDHKLLGVPHEGGYRIPAIFVQDGQVVKGLSGTLTLLADAGFSEIEALRWLFTDDDTLPGTPAQALAENRGTEIRRRAQALAF
ncbi:Rv2175c family DNA-binding protein [Actinomadura scrupuli]|uniref:Rv2175c family DNA-binding protein n=1 Tax=Actinomadura scrupuli TaxID=559629 RepID=UPI003D980407